MDLLKSKEEIDLRLMKLDFKELWNSFHSFPYALYTSKEIMLEGEIIPYTNEFIGNTVIKYQGRYIAIWNVEYSFIKDYDVLTSKLVHEMFHCLQFENKWSEFPDELALKRICDNERFYQLKYYENQLLVKAIKVDRVEPKRELFKQFQNVRLHRMKIDASLLCEELKVEYIEGNAEYVGIKALEMLSKEKAQEVVNEYCTILTSISFDQFNLRKISYYVGAVYFLLAEQLNWIEVMVEEPLFEIKLTCDVAEQFILYKNSLHDTIQSSIKDKHRIQYKAKICGYDPMNLFIFEGYLYSSNFLLIRNKRETKEFREKIVVELDESGKAMVAYWE